MAKDRKVSAKWMGGWACEVAAGDHLLRVDEPESVAGGTDTGPQPTEMLLASVSSCFALALAFAARKRSIELTHIDVDATGIYDGPSFSEIVVEASVGCDEADLQRIVSAAERYCYVTNTIRGGAKLTISATI